MNLEQLIADMHQESSAPVGDVVATARAISGKTNMFLQDRGVCASTESMQGVQRLSGTFDSSAFQGIGLEGITALVSEAGVPEQHVEAAVEELALILGRASVAAGNAATIVASHLSQADISSSARQNVVGYEALMPESLHHEYQASSSGMEHFGVDTDKLAADLSTAITISLMKWHDSIIARLLPTIASSNPLVVYQRDEYMIYDLADSENELLPVLDLFKNPSKVANTLKLIVLDAGGADIDSDGILPLNKTVNMFANTDSSEFNNGSFNRTDLVADDVRIDTVVVKIVDANDGGAAITEYVDIKIPASRNRLTRIPNSASTARGLSLSFTSPFAAGTVAIHDDGTSAPATSDNVDTIMIANGADVLNVRLNMTISVDIASSDAMAYGNMSLSFAAADGTVSGDQSLDPDMELSIEGIVLDARYSEENYRKSSIVSTQTVRDIVFEVPPGRTYAADRSHAADANGANKDRQVANLRQLAGIGQDSIGLSVIDGFLDTVIDETAAFKADKVNNQRPGLLYPAGGKVNPCVITAELNLSGIQAFDDAHMRLAIGGRVETVLNSVVADLMTESLMRQQMAPGSKLVFRAVCSGEVLSKVIAAGSKTVEAGAGVEYALELPDGTVIEFITTTFTDIQDEIRITPYIKGAPGSDLNFAHNRSCGMVVCAFDATTDNASSKRLMASLREMPVPTNIVGARIQVKGMFAADGPLFAYVPAP